MERQTFREQNGSVTFAEKSSGTAVNQAIWRAFFTTIPFAWEILCATDFIVNDKILKSPALARMPLFEARFLVTDKLLKEYFCRQVVELAAGFSPRGLKFTSNPHTTYVEVDLPQTSYDKIEVVNRMISGGKVAPRPNLHFVQGDVTDAATFENVVSWLSGDNANIIFEGLDRYVSFEGKRVYFQGSRNIIGTEGVCITSDTEFFDPRNPLPGQVERYETFKKRTGMDVRPNLFRNRQHMEVFCNEIGFQAEWIPYLDVISVDNLNSPQELNLKRAYVEQLLSGREVLILKAA